MCAFKVIRTMQNIFATADLKFCVKQPLALYSVSSKAADVKTNTFQMNLIKDRDSFQDVLPGIVEALTKKSQFAQIPDVANWLKTVLTYNLDGGKKYRGISTVIAYEMLEKSENITAENMKLARILGWCVEMLQAYLVVLDDMMDGSSTRRGVACWYTRPDVGVSAINDSILIYTSLLQVLKMYFNDKPHYIKMCDVFNETLTYTCMGQYIDTATNKQEVNKPKTYTLFTPEQYKSIIKYKTAFYTYKLPISLGLLLANNADEAAHKTIEELSIQIGMLFQVQDDFIDCYSDESVSGKAGTDIQEGKCSWLAVQALQRCNENQRRVFEKCYGSKEPAHVERIKQLYNDLGLPDVYRDFEKSSYDRVVEKINYLPQELSPQLFMRLLDMIYKRKQ